MSEALKNDNIVVYFFMIGCPYCEKTKPYWEELKKNLPPNMKHAEIESNDVDDELEKTVHINGFPHFVIKKDGKQKEVSGSKNSTKELADSLGIKLKKGGSRSLHRRRRSRRSRRSIRKRFH